MLLGRPRWTLSLPGPGLLSARALVCGLQIFPTRGSGSTPGGASICGTCHCHSLSLAGPGPGPGLWGSWKRPQLLCVHRGLAPEWHLLTW